MFDKTVAGGLPGSSPSTPVSNSTVSEQVAPQNNHQTVPTTQPGSVPPPKDLVVIHTNQPASLINANSSRADEPNVDEVETDPSSMIIGPSTPEDENDTMMVMMMTNGPTKQNNMLMTLGQAPAQPPTLLKLFVGQIPRHLQEIHVRPLFDPFGPILEFTILKDKITGIHKGCAFLTYANNEDAINAINAVHEKIVLPGVTNHTLTIACGF